MSTYERIKSFLTETTASGDIESLSTAITLRRSYVRHLHNGDPINVLAYNYCMANVEKDFEIAVQLSTGEVVKLQVDSRCYITRDQALSLIDTICSSCQMIMKVESKKVQNLRDDWEVVL